MGVSQDVLPDLSGQWTLQTTASFSPAAGASTSGVNTANCTFEGTATVSQDGGSIMGPVSLTLTSGSPECPKDMQANLSGDLQGTQFGGTLDGGDMFGTADFTGSLNSDRMTLSGELKFSQAPAGPVGQQAGGGFNVRAGGPFAGGMGNWMAQMMAGGPAPIPTLGDLGVALLAAALLLSGVLFMRRASY